MSEQQIPIDNHLDFGTYAPNANVLKRMAFMRRLPTNWFGKRLMFFLRSRTRKALGTCVDVDLFDAKLRLYVAGNVSEKRALFAPQFFDLEEREALRGLAQDEAVFIDIGANVGLYSFSTAETFKRHKKTRIIAVEPHPEISKRLTYNLSNNPDLPIEHVQMGLSDKDGTMRLFTPNNNLGESRLLKDGEQVDGPVNEVPVKTLLGLLREKNISRIDGMKIDIEGYEEAVLIPFMELAPDALLPKLIIIENNFDKWATDLLSLAAARGYYNRSYTRMNVMLNKQ